jgi:hypothetical protein
MVVCCRRNLPFSTKNLFHAPALVCILVVVAGAARDFDMGAEPAALFGEKEGTSALGGRFMRRVLDIVARVAFAVIATAVVVTLTSGQACASLTALVPAYFYPGTGGTQGYTNGWDQLDASAGSIPIQAIVNPDSGPGPAVDPNYTKVVNNFVAAGGQPIGYVYTNYGFRSLSDVENDVVKWLTFYPKITGFFIDQMSTDPAFAPTYYHSLYSFIKSQGPSLTVVANPGTNTSEAYASNKTADKLVVFEGTEASYLSYSPASWMSKYSARLFADIVYDTPTVKDMQHVLTLSVQNRSGSAYVTDNNFPNPYNRMPSYWNEEVAALGALSPLPEPSSMTIAMGSGLLGFVAFTLNRRFRRDSKGSQA